VDETKLMMEKFTQLIKMIRTDELEHPQYHPERFLRHHILLVALRAKLYTNDIDLILAAVLHDSHKHTSGKFRPVKKGPWAGTMYWSNYHHAAQATNMIDNDNDIKLWIEEQGGNWEVVSFICREHMNGAHSPNRIKNLRKKGIDEEWIEKLLLFCKLDDMTHNPGDFVMKGIYITIPDSIDRIGVVRKERTFLCDLGFVNQSVLQRGTEWLTIEANRTPYDLEYKDIPRFFKDEPEVKKFLERLI
jgi:hypothetical protein